MKIQLETENITIFESALYKTTTTLVKLENLLLLVDPNWLPNEIDFIGKYVNQIKGDKPLYLIFTHSDFDHIIGAGAFDCKGMIAAYSFSNEIDQQKVLNDIYSFDQQYYLSRDYPIIYPEPTILIKNKEQQLLIEEEALTFYLAPGHTKDSIIMYIHSLNLLIVGDYLSDVEFPFIENVTDYLITLKMLEKIIHIKKINYLIPGHGNYTDQVSEMEKRWKESFDYISGLQQKTPMELLLKNKYEFYDGIKQFHELNKLLIKDK